MGILDAINAQEFGGYDGNRLREEQYRRQLELAKALTGNVADVYPMMQAQPYQRPPDATVQSQQGASLNPLQAAQTYNQIAPMFGGEPLWGGASTVGGSSAPVSGSMSGVGTAANSSSVAGSSMFSGGGSAGGSAGGAAGGSWGSAAASAAPWAALAAIIIANESKQRGDGNRGNSGWEHAGDLLTGKVLERDLDRYLAHNKAGGTVKRAAMMSTPSGIVRNTKDFGGWLKGLFD